MWPIELIDYMRRNYEPPNDFSEVEEEAKHMSEQVQKRAAGRVFTQPDPGVGWLTREQRDAATRAIYDRYKVKL